MAWAYILRGDSGRHYIGSTTDLERRLKDHRRGQTHSTKRLGGNLEIVAAVELAGLDEARSLEREMKRKKNPRLHWHYCRAGYDGAPESFRGWFQVQVLAGVPSNLQEFSAGVIAVSFGRTTCDKLYAAVLPPGVSAVTNCRLKLIKAK